MAFWKVRYLSLSRLEEEGSLPWEPEQGRCLTGKLRTRLARIPAQEKGREFTTSGLWLPSWQPTMAGIRRRNGTGGAGSRPEQGQADGGAWGGFVTTG